jgi:hypothetical protein
VRCGALGDALDDPLTSTVKGEEDRDAGARVKVIQDQPVRKRDTRGIRKDDVVGVLLLENADHDSRHHSLNVLLVPGEGLLDFSPTRGP